MYVIVLVLAVLADDVTNRTPVLPSGIEFNRVLRENEAKLLPSAIPTNEKDGNLRYLTIDVPDVQKASRTAEALRLIPGVQTAYVKPRQALP